jgi:hypothetical protein
MIAAWAPVSLPRQPFLAAGILVIATGLFLMATRSAPQPAATESGRVGPFDPHAHNRRPRMTVDGRFNIERCADYGFLRSRCARPHVRTASISGRTDSP